MNVPIRLAHEIQDEIASRRASATAELFLIKGDIRALNRRAEALVEILEACSIAAKAIDLTQSLSGANEAEGTSLRTQILVYVHKAGREGVTTEQVLEHLQESYAKPFHPKTPMMTLSRLKSAGFIQRSGKRWHAEAASL